MPRPVLQTRMVCDEFSLTVGQSKGLRSSLGADVGFRMRLILQTRMVVVTALLLVILSRAAGCVTAESWEAARVLKDIDAGGGPSELKATTPEPSRSTVTYEIDGRASVADIYVPNQPIGAALVLVPGFTPRGKDDLRLVDLAFSLARARFLVLVPDLVGSRQMQIRPVDARAIADAVVRISDSDLLVGGQEVGLVAISYAVGLAILASSEPDTRDRVDFLVGIGGYFDTTAVVTYSTTGRYRETAADDWQRAEPNPAAKWLVLASNVDLLANHIDREALTAIADRKLEWPEAPVGDLVAQLGTEGRSLWEVFANNDPARVQGLLDRLPDTVTRRLTGLSPSNHDLSHLAGRLILIHGRADSLIPYTESLALGRAVPGSKVFIIDDFSHIDRTDVALAGQLQLIDSIQAVLERRQN